MKGHGALRTPARDRGQRGIYGHCHWNGKIIWKEMIMTIMLYLFNNIYIIYIYMYTGILYKDYTASLHHCDQATFFFFLTKTLTATTASATPVSTAGLRECNRILLSRRTKCSSVAQFSGPRFMSSVP